jgi:hypothetical protein
LDSKLYLARKIIKNKSNLEIVFLPNWFFTPLYKIGFFSDCLIIFKSMHPGFENWVIQNKRNNTLHLLDEEGIAIVDNWFFDNKVQGKLQKPFDLILCSSKSELRVRKKNIDNEKKLFCMQNIRLFLASKVKYNKKLDYKKKINILIVSNFGKISHSFLNQEKVINCDQDNFSSKSRKERLNMVNALKLEWKGLIKDFKEINKIKKKNIHITYRLHPSESKLNSIYLKREFPWVKIDYGKNSVSNILKHNKYTHVLGWGSTILIEASFSNINSYNLNYSKKENKNNDIVPNNVSKIIPKLLSINNLIKGNHIKNQKQNLVKEFFDNSSINNYINLVQVLTKSYYSKKSSLFNIIILNILFSLVLIWRFFKIPKKENDKIYNLSKFIKSNSTNNLFYKYFILFINK